MIMETHTGNVPNGYWLDESPETVANIYILGVADGLYARRLNLGDPLCRDNPSLNRDNIVEIVRAYYKQKPKNKFRQIVAVIRSGCL